MTTKRKASDHEKRSSEEPERFVNTSERLFGMNTLLTISGPSHVKSVGWENCCQVRVTAERSFQATKRNRLTATSTVQQRLIITNQTKLGSVHESVISTQYQIL